MIDRLTDLVKRWYDEAEQAADNWYDDDNGEWLDDEIEGEYNATVAHADQLEELIRLHT